MGKKAKLLFSQLFPLIILVTMTVIMLPNTNSNLISNHSSSGTTSLNVIMGEGRFIINGEEITMFLYHNNIRYDINSSPSQGGLPVGLKNQINFSTDIIEEGTGRFRYNHTFSQAVTQFITKVGYVPPTNCLFNNPILDCGEYRFDFTDAIEIQNLIVNYSNNELTFEGEDLSYIDPIIQSNGAPDLTRSSSSEGIVKNSSGSLFVLYSNDSTTMTAISDDSGSTWRHSYTGLNCDFDTDGQYGTLLINSTNAIHVICSDINSVDTVYSTDSGGTWSSPVQIHSNNADYSLDASIGPNDQMIVCISILNDDQIYNSSTSGASWTRTDNAYTGRGCAVEIDSTGMYHLATISVVDGDDVRYYNTTDPTEWTETIVYDGISFANNEIELAIDPLDDEVFILTTRESGSPSQLFIFNSTNNLDFIETAITMSGVTIDFLDLAIDVDGGLHIITTEQSSVTNAEIYYSTSTDGGMTWSSASALETPALVDDLFYADLRGSRYPSFNNLSTVIEYVYFNDSQSDIYFGNYIINLPPIQSTLNTPSDLSSQNFNNSVFFNWTGSDPNGGTLDYTIYADTNTDPVTIINTTSGTSGVSVTFNWTNTTGGFPDGLYYWKVSADDGTNTPVNSSISSFQISTVSPSISLDYPMNNRWFNNETNIYLNYTAIDSDGVDTCDLYSNWTGTWHINNTNSTISSGVQDFIIRNLTEGGLWTWNVFCNDTSGNGDFGLNRTFGVDLTNPEVNITDITTETGSQTITFDHTASDSLSGLNNCFFSIFDSTGGIDGVNSNLSVTCNSTNVGATVTAFSSYNLTIYANDSAGNQNSSTQSFTTTQVTPGAPAGGGGAGTPTEEAEQLIPVIGLKEINGSREYSDLEREIIYSTLNNYCSEIITNEDTLAIEDFSGQCLIGFDDLNIILQRLEEFDVQSNPEDLTQLFGNYKRRNLFQGLETQETILLYNLFTSILGETTRLRIFPAPSIDTPYVFYEPEGSSRNATFTLTSNKPLKSCETISETPHLTCTFNGSIIKVNYVMENTNFLSRIFSGTLLVTTEAEPDRVEQQRIPVAFRAFNTGYKNIPLVGGIILILAVSIFFIADKRKRKKAIDKIKDLTTLS